MLTPPACWIAGSHLHTFCLCSNTKYQSRLSRNTGSSSACPRGHVPRSNSKPTSSSLQTSASLMGVSIFGLLWWQFNSAFCCFQNASADLTKVPCHIISCLWVFTSRWFSWPAHQIPQSNSVSTPQSNGTPETVLPPSPSGAGTTHCLPWQGSGKLGWVSLGISSLCG